MNSQATRGFNPAVLAAFLTAAAAGQAHAGGDGTKATPGSTEAFIQASKDAEARVKKAKADYQKAKAETEKAREESRKSKEAFARAIAEAKETVKPKNDAEIREISSRIAKSIKGLKGPALKAKYQGLATEFAKTESTLDDSVLRKSVNSKTKSVLGRRVYKMSQKDGQEILASLPAETTKAKAPKEVKKPDVKVSKADTKKKTGEALAMVRNETVAPKIKAPQRTPGENTKANKR